MKLIVCSVFLIAIYSQVQVITAALTLEEARQSLQDQFTTTNEKTENLLAQQNDRLDQLENSALGSIISIENKHPLTDVSNIVSKANGEIRKTVRESRTCVQDAAANAKDTVNGIREGLTSRANLKKVTTLQERVRTTGTDLPAEVENCQVGLKEALAQIVADTKAIIEKRAK